MFLELQAKKAKTTKDKPKKAMNCPKGKKTKVCIYLFFFIEIKPLADTTLSESHSFFYL